MELPLIRASRKSGEECFDYKGKEQGVCWLDFGAVTRPIEVDTDSPFVVLCVVLEDSFAMF